MMVGYRRRDLPGSSNGSKNRIKYKKGEAIVDKDGFTLFTHGGVFGKTLVWGEDLLLTLYDLELSSSSSVTLIIELLLNLLVL